jgi:hypothetical protein
MKRQLDDIRGRWAKATPGPWLRGGTEVFDAAMGVVIADTRSFHEPTNEREIEDAEAIAHAPADVQYLLNVIDQLLGELGG